VKRTLVWLAAARGAVELLAIPLAPLLYEDHFLLLVLLRPTKEVLLAGGFLAREGEVALWWILVAALPLMVFGVWLMFWLGRAYAREIRDGGLPGIGSRVLPAERIHRLHRALRRRGAKLVVLGRLAVFPSTLVGAAAGSSRMGSREFVRADAAGAALSLVEVVGAGYVLGEAYEEAGPWLTASGVVALAVALVLLGRALRKT
jgi:membrane protein DedA with SNARE-associated domain